MVEDTLPQKRWLKTTHDIYVFMVNGKAYGLDIAWIKEIKEIGSARAITPVPHTHKSMLGYINVRGEINQVLSLSEILQGEPDTVTDNGLIIYFKEKAGIHSGAYALSIREIITVEDDDIDLWDNDRPENGNAPSEYVTCGVCRNGKEIIHLLSAQRLCEAAGFDW